MIRQVQDCAHRTYCSRFTDDLEGAFCMLCKEAVAQPSHIINNTLCSIFPESRRSRQLQQVQAQQSALGCLCRVSEPRRCAGLRSVSDTC